MDTYVLRIYRPPTGTSQLVLGVVERVGTNRFQRFSSFDELREIITQGHELCPATRKEERRRRVGERNGSVCEEKTEAGRRQRGRATGRRSM